MRTRLKPQKLTTIGLMRTANADRERNVKRVFIHPSNFIDVSIDPSLKPLRRVILATELDARVRLLERYSAEMVEAETTQT